MFVDSNIIKHASNESFLEEIAPIIISKFSFLSWFKRSLSTRVVLSFNLAFMQNGEMCEVLDT